MTGQSDEDIALGSDLRAVALMNPGTIEAWSWRLRTPNATIASELSVSPNTVSTHIRKIYAKLGARDRSSAVQCARAAATSGRPHALDGLDLGFCGGGEVADAAQHVDRGQAPAAASAAHGSVINLMVTDKLREAVADREVGVTTDAKYTVEDAVNDFLAKGLKGRSKTTIDNYRSLADRNLIPQIGGIRLKELTADQVDDRLDERAEELATRTLRLIHQILEREIRQAQARDKVRRNVASLVDVPEGQEGRPPS